MDLYLDTPLSKAIFELLSQLNTEIGRQLSAVHQKGAVKAYIFGGCAVHILTNSRGSNDLDVEFEAAKQLNLDQLMLDLDDVYFNDSEQGESQLALDGNFNIGLTPVMSPDYKMRAIPLSTGACVLHTFLVHPLDIAISKLSRCEIDDVADIVALFRRNYFTLEEFREASQLASSYCATPERLRSNIDHVILVLCSLSKEF